MDDSLTRERVNTGFDALKMAAQSCGLNTAEVEKLRDLALSALRQDSSGGEEICCKEFETCKRPCTPRGMELQASAYKSAASGVVLDRPAQIGATRFGVGVKWSTVIDRAQREWDYFHGLVNPRSSDAPQESRSEVLHEAAILCLDIGETEMVRTNRSEIARTYQIGCENCHDGILALASRAEPGAPEMPLPLAHGRFDAEHEPETPEPSVDYARVAVHYARMDALEEAANELERAFAECDTLNLLHGAARVRSLKEPKND